MGNKRKFKRQRTKEKQGIPKRTNIQTAIPHKNLSVIINIIINIILKQIANKIIKKIAKFQIFISIFKNPNANSQFLFNFNKISGGNL
jgi:hypothetical protein